MHDLIEFFIKPWTVEEWIIVGAVILWIPILKIAVFIFIHLGIKLPMTILKKYSKLVLRTVYWFTVIASFANLLSKVDQGYEFGKMLAIIVGYTFMLVIDYLETEIMIKKIEEEYKE